MRVYQFRHPGRWGEENTSPRGPGQPLGVGYLDFPWKSPHTSPPMGRENDKQRVVATNRRARHDYLILDDLVCGVELRGTEVKSLREGKAEIAQAYGQIRGGELFLIGSSIPEYSHGTAHNHVVVRDRRLLAKRREIDKWYKKVREKGVTIVPLDVFFEGHLVKVRMALAQGKKLYDKRQAEKEKSARRDMRDAQRRR